MHQVAKKSPNSVGLYDVAGNLREWCLDWCTSTYTGGADGVCVVSGTSYRFSRGGSYWNVYPRSCSLGSFSAENPNNLGRDYGFRLAVVP
jgi:formylglycine-generating enzyme required for sulfatase activity